MQRCYPGVLSCALLACWLWACGPRNGGYAPNELPVDRLSILDSEDLDGSLEVNQNAKVEVTEQATRGSSAGSGLFSTVREPTEMTSKDGRIGRQRFFLETETGALGMMANVRTLNQARRADTYLVFPESGLYRVDKLEDWFHVNHRVFDDSRPVRTYLGVTVAKVLRKDRLEDDLQLVRNRGWMPSKNGYEDALYAAETFWKVHTPAQEEIPPFPEEFAEWHASLSLREGEVNSWDERRYWKRWHGECLEALKKRVKVREGGVLVQVRLMTFVPTRRRDSGRPVVWKAALGDANGVYVRTFSPGRADYEAEYCIWEEEGDSGVEAVE